MKAGAYRRPHKEREMGGGCAFRAMAKGEDCGGVSAIQEMGRRQQEMAYD